MGQPVPMAMPQRMPMMTNGMPQMGGPTGFMGKGKHANQKLNVAKHIKIKKSWDIRKN